MNLYMQTALKFFGRNFHEGTTVFQVQGKSSFDLFLLVDRVD